MKLTRIVNIFLFIFATTKTGSTKIHHLVIMSDPRLYIEVTDFAFLKGAYFNVDLSNFTSKIDGSKELGFTFSKGRALEEVLRSNPSICPLAMTEEDGIDDFEAIYFLLNFPNKSLDIVRRGASVERIQICAPSDLYQGSCAGASRDTGAVAKPTQTGPALAVSTVPSTTSFVALGNNSNEHASMNNANLTWTKKTMKRGARFKKSLEPVSTDDDTDEYGTWKSNSLNYLPLTLENKGYHTQFSIQFWRPIEEGEYYFIFHNCFNYRRDYSERELVSFTLSVVEKNADSYLPAGEIANTKLYFALAVLFLGTALSWVLVLQSNKENIYKIHYLMTALVFIKSLSLFFHGVNFYFISTRGRQQEALKGALLFGTIILIGTGWTFFKNFLTDRDRRLFMIILPLQVIDNIALIIILESEEGERSYRFWWQLFILVDLLCCAAIILPVICRATTVAAFIYVRFDGELKKESNGTLAVLVATAVPEIFIKRSIRHLQEASQTDGKAAFNLRKLKLFRHFYIIVIIYIYTTRILRYLISFVVPFQFEWILVVVEEMGTWFFFVITGYKFRPATNNPYLRLAQSDDEEMDTALTQPGALDGVVRVNRPTTIGSTRKQRRNEEIDEQETSLLAEHSLEHD